MTVTWARTRARLASLPTLAVVALTVGAALVLGVVGGGTLALWRDTETVTARMPVGVVVFGVGAPAPAGTLADYATSPTDTVDFTFGAAAAATLYTTGAVAIPFQVDALAQGHRGLTYTVTRTIAPGGVFADSTVRLVRVASPAACTTSAAGPDTTSSTPVAATYSDTRVLTVEHWCLVATFERMKGTYGNTASVDAGVSTSGGLTAQRATDQDSWSAQVRKTFVPANEPQHRLTLSFTTTRPVP
ncbi:SipW-dependent-type signal peptide-containing protein [Cellulomonas phragmiteti]|uniref:SipW-cognate class signal peptide n=1 Tax=Cellulomonas phragmiteti TaxID=478780 RepID=A0ABQ4DI16_9CELL|nr:SipW-dependent-type signal peptide-containing protein [Cellulomonas phragmiteti]GIG38995.1 hypothetical protein Cph01nite_07570 [Cellulomonas phragmiteti]